MEMTRTQSTRFGQLDLQFDSRVLEPRPWTLVQSHWAAEMMRTVPSGPVLELCAGVGHIGLHATHDSGRDLVLIDLSEVACRYARINAGAAGMGPHTDIRHAPIDEAVRAEERFAVIIADPPWVPTGVIDQYPDDPRIAIDGGPEGTDLIFTCLNVIGNHLLAAGAAVLQVGTQAQATVVRQHLAGRPELNLVIADIRAPGENGVIVLLRRA